MRLQAAGLISRCIYLLWPSPHVTAPSLWPCVGRSGGQSTTIALHLGGCWWRRGWGGGNYGNTAGPAEYHSLGNVFIIMAIICPCNGFNTTLNRLSRKERTVVHAASLGGTPPSQKTQCEGRDNVEQPLLTVPELRAAAALSSNVQPVTLLCEWIGRTSPPRSTGSPMQPQQEETNANIADVSPLHAGRNPLYIKKKRDVEKRGRSKQLSQEAITLLSEKRKVGSGCFWVFFPHLSSASSTSGAAAGDPAHTSLNIRHLAPTRRGASSFAHQPLRGCRTTTSSATWLTDWQTGRQTDREGGGVLEGWAPPAATQKAESLKSTPRSCVTQTLEVTISFYITIRTSSSHFCAGACDGNMVSVLKGYPRVTAWSRSPR